MTCFLRIPIAGALVFVLSLTHINAQKESPAASGSTESDSPLNALVDSAVQAYNDGLFQDVADWLAESPLITNQTNLENPTLIRGIVVLASSLLELGRLDEASNQMLKLRSIPENLLPPEYFRCLAEINTRQEIFSDAVTAFEKFFALERASGRGYKFPDAQNFLSVLLESGNHKLIDEWFNANANANKSFLNELQINNPKWYVELSLIRAESLLRSSQYNDLKKWLNEVRGFRLSSHQLWAIHYLEYIADLESGAIRPDSESQKVIVELRELARASARKEAIWKTALAESKAWLTAGRYQKARDALYPLLRDPAPLSTVLSEAFLNMSQSYLKEGKFSEAQQWLEQFSDEKLAGPYSGWAMLTSAQIYFQNYLSLNREGMVAEGRLALLNAQEAAEYVVNLIPGSDLGSHARYQLGWCLLESGRLIPAREEFEAAFSLFPPGIHQLEALLKVGDIHLALDQKKEAVKSFESAMDLVNQYRFGDQTVLSRLELALVQAYISDGNTEKARDIVMALIENDPSRETTVHALLAWCQYLVSHHGDTEVVPLLNNVLSHVSDVHLRGLIEENMIYALVERGEWGQAQERAEHWISVYSLHSHLDDVMYQLCYLTLQNLGREAALHRFHQFISKFPDHPKSPTCQFWVAQYFFDRGEYDNALRSFNTISQSLESSDATLLREAEFKIALCYARLGNYAVAFSLIEKLIESIRNLTSKSVSDMDLLMRANLALTEIYLNDPSYEKDGIELAHQLLKQFMNNFPDSPHIDEVRNYTARMLLRFPGPDTNENFPSEMEDPLNLAESYFKSTIDSPRASPSLKAEASIGLGIILEKKADLLPEDQEKIPLLKQAAGQFRKVFYQSPDNVSPFWIKKAGISAFRLASLLDDHNQSQILQSRFYQLFQEKISF